MKNELYKALKSIDINKLSEDDKLELLGFFEITNSSLIRNQIAFMLSDLQYNYAIPHILKKINQKELFNNNGSLVYALQGLDTKKYFQSIIEIICKQDFEARLEAFEIIENDISSVSTQQKQKAIKVLKECAKKEAQSINDKGENSRLHFIEQTEKVINQSLDKKNKKGPR
jgi:hypothetical protein